MNEELNEDLEGLDRGRGAGVDAVIIGDLGEPLGFEMLNRAFRQVMDGADLIALQKNRFWMTPDGLSLDAGPFVAAIEYATGREAVVVGKPAPAFFELVLADLGVSAGQAAMVGDDVETDVGGAIDAGIAGILVRTGKYREDFVANRDRADRDRGLDRGRPGHCCEARTASPLPVDSALREVGERSPATRGPATTGAAIDYLGRDGAERRGAGSGPATEQRADELVAEASELAARSWAGASSSPPRAAAETRCRPPPSPRAIDPMGEYPEDLRELVDSYLEGLRFSPISHHRGPRGGDALLAARRRQADPARCWRLPPRARSASTPRACCRRRRRSS